MYVYIHFAKSRKVFALLNSICILEFKVSPSINMRNNVSYQHRNLYTFKDYNMILFKMKPLKCFINRTSFVKKSYMLKMDCIHILKCNTFKRMINNLVCLTGHY